jgi:hypothetical protein
VIEVAAQWRRSGDQIVAEVAHFLHTPFPECRRIPLGLLLRMHEQAVRIGRALRS